MTNKIKLEHRKCIDGRKHTPCRHCQQCTKCDTDIIEDNF